MAFLLMQMFEGIASVRHDAHTGEIASISDCYSETVSLGKRVPCAGIPVEGWLQNLEAEMRSTLRHLTATAIKQVSNCTHNSSVYGTYSICGTRLLAAN